MPVGMVRVAALEASGVPEHVVDFCQEHLYAELQRQGFAVLRADASPQEMQAADPRAVVVGELVHFPNGFRVTTRARTEDTGRVFAEHVAQAVPEQRLLDALSAAVEQLAPKLRAQLAPVVPVAQPAAPERPLRRWAWAPVAGGAVFLGVGTAFLLEARSKQQELEGPRVTGEPVLDGEAVAREGQRAQTLSRVSYALGGTAVLAGAAMYFLPVEKLWGGGGEPQPLQLRLSPTGVGVSGVFP